MATGYMKLTCIGEFDFARILSVKQKVILYHVSGSDSLHASLKNVKRSQIFLSITSSEYMFSGPSGLLAYIRAIAE